MENQGMINCPNCNKRIFADSDKCIYCKYILKEKEHNFDKEIYDFLYCKYNENKNKPETIKAGIEKFGISTKESKEIVDHISEQFYYKEEAEKNKKTIETTEKKEKIKNELLSCPNVFKFSFLQYFIHSIMPKATVIALLTILISQLIKNNVYDSKSVLTVIYIVEAFILFYAFLTDLCNKATQKFTVESGRIEYERPYFSPLVGNPHRLHDDKDDYRTMGKYEIYYNIHFVKKVEERFNSIVIYGDVTKTFIKRYGSSNYNRKSTKTNKLKVTKSFKNNKKLIKSLQILAK